MSLYLGNPYTSNNDNIACAVKVCPQEVAPPCYHNYCSSYEAPPCQENIGCEFVTCSANLPVCLMDSNRPSE